MKARTLAYWLCTGLLCLGIFSGGLASLTRQPETVAGAVLLGYPPYFLTLLGAWKVLGASALILPGMPRIKEWAYAGLFINVSAAAISHAAVRDWGATGFHIWVNLIFLALIVASWALRPADRILGSVSEGFSPLRPRKAPSGLNQSA